MRIEAVKELVVLLFALTVIVMVVTRGTFSTFTNPSPLLHIDACPRFLTHLPNAFLKDHSLGDLGWNLGRTSVFKFSTILMLTFTKCTKVVVIHRSLGTLPRESHLGSPSLVTKHWIYPICLPLILRLFLVEVSVWLSTIPKLKRILACVNLGTPLHPNPFQWPKSHHKMLLQCYSPNRM